MVGLDLLLKIPHALWSLLSWFRPPLSVLVLRLEFSDNRYRPGDYLVVAVGCPLCYVAELQIINCSSRLVFIKEIRLLLHQEHKSRTGEICKTIQLQPGEPKEEYIQFPLREEEPVVQESSFEIQVVPTVGRKSKAKGRFPIRKS